MPGVPDRVPESEPVSDVRADSRTDTKPYSDSKPLTYCFSDAIARAFAATEHSKSNAAAYAESHGFADRDSGSRTDPHQGRLVLRGSDTARMLRKRG